MVNGLLSLDGADDGREPENLADNIPLLPNYWSVVYGVLKGDSSPTMIDDTSNSRGFGHIKIYDRSVGTRLTGASISRERWIATYLVARLRDPAGYLWLLGRFPDWTIYGVSAGAAASAGKKIAAKRGSSMSFTYASEEGSTDECCDVQYGNDLPVL